MEDYCGFECSSVRREVLYGTLIGFWVTTRSVRLIKICLNEWYCEVCVGKHLSDSFAIEISVIEGDALSTLL
jgi:hypothetical protein